jgi:hypothetical protein
MQVNQLIDCEMLGETDLFLGIQIKRSDDGSYTLSQQLYLDAMLDEFRYSDTCKIDMPMDAGAYELACSIQATDDEGQVHGYGTKIGKLIYL